MTVTPIARELLAINAMAESLLFCCFRLIEAIKKLRPQQPELQQEGVPSETPLQQPMRQNQHERVRLQSWNTVLRLSSRQAGAAQSETRVPTINALTMKV